MSVFSGCCTMIMEVLLAIVDFRDVVLIIVVVAMVLVHASSAPVKYPRESSVRQGSP